MTLIADYWLKAAEPRGRRGSAGWAAPAAVELDGGRLLWKPGRVDTRKPPKPGPADKPNPWRYATRETLVGFLGLANATPEEIANFAISCGTLGLCHHGVPWGRHGDCIEAPELAPPAEPSAEDDFGAWLRA